MTSFSRRVLEWHAQHGRHDLPWQHPRTPYRVWVAEIMLQQTQVATVIPYFTRFITRFPDVRTLAASAIDDVMAHWSGLGYYARARNLHAAAGQLVQLHDGVFPERIEDWLALPGVGRSTAGAVLAQAFGQRHAILDGNVRRLLARHQGIEGWVGGAAVARRLWAAAESLLPRTDLPDYTQGMMDLGAMLCRRTGPECTHCPVAADCVARRTNRVASLPSARPQRQRRRREVVLTLVEDDHHRWMLERRPPSGVWGGLWCPPMIDAEADWRSELGSRFGIEAGAFEALATVDHRFTHFDLHIRPLRVRPRTNSAVRDGGEGWFKLHDVQALGLPAPVRRLFTHLQQDAKPCPEPSTAPSSTSKPKGSIARRTPARSARASTKTSRSKPGRTGSHNRPV